MKKTTKRLDNFAEESGTLIYGLATVPDNWISQLKTYYKIELEDSDTSIMWLTTIALYIELLVARVDDILTPEEGQVLERKLIERILHYTELINFHGQKEVGDRVKAVSNILNEIITISKGKRVEHGDTIPQTYVYSFIKSFGDRIPEEIITDYLKSKIELFEEQNFRSKLENLD